MVRALILAAALGAGLCAPAQAACRLALALALDVSSSVDAKEHQLQMEGLAGALGDPDIRAAVLGGTGSVYLAIYEWSGRRQQSLLLDWTELTDDAAIDAVIARILAAPRSETRFPTALGYALGYGAGLLQSAPPCDRRVIDVSGDGINNDGFRPKLAYKHFPFDGVTVNGLAVLGSDDRIVTYYEGELRHGPGAFVETADGYAGYRRAMTRKLFREINSLVIGQVKIDRSDTDHR